MQLGLPDTLKGGGSHVCDGAAGKEGIVADCSQEEEIALEEGKEARTGEWEEEEVEKAAPPLAVLYRITLEGALVAAPMTGALVEVTHASQVTPLIQ